MIASGVGIFYFVGSSKGTASNYQPGATATSGQPQNPNKVATTSSGNPAATAAANTAVGATATANTVVGATATAIASNPNINPYSPGGGTPVLNDPLNSNNYNWQTYNDTATGNACQFVGNAYHIVRAGNYGGPCFAQSTNFSNFTYQVQMTFFKVGQKFSGGGIVFRADSVASTYYYFQVYESGKYTLISCAGNDCSHELAGYPAQPQAIPSFNTAPGQPNTLAVVANGSSLTIYVNGNLVVGPVTDAAYSHGMIGVYAEGGSEGGPGATADIAFSDAKVWQL